VATTRQAGNLWPQDAIRNLLKYKDLRSMRDCGAIWHSGCFCSRADPFGDDCVLLITPTYETAATTLKVQGKLTRQSVSELAKACLPHLERPADLVLDFSSLVFVDEAGVKVVQDLIRRDVRIRGCSPLVANLLKESQE
jgi:anti-anti-sigma regulatory factor